MMCVSMVRVRTGTVSPFPNSVFIPQNYTVFIMQIPADLKEKTEDVIQEY